MRSHEWYILTIMIVVLLFFGFFFYNLYYLDDNLPSPDSGDFSKPLKNDYFLHRTASDYIFVTKNDYQNNPKIIPEKIIKINVFNDYILACRQAFKLNDPKKDTAETYLIPDEKTFLYIIFDTKSGCKFDGLTKSRFDNLLDSLSIPKQTKLIDVEKY